MRLRNYLLGLYLGDTVFEFYVQDAFVNTFSELQYEFLRKLVESEQVF